MIHNIDDTYPLLERLGLITGVKPKGRFIRRCIILQWLQADSDLNMLLPNKRRLYYKTKALIKHDHHQLRNETGRYEDSK